MRASFKVWANLKDYWLVIEIQSDLVIDKQNLYCETMPCSLPSGKRERNETRLEGGKVKTKKEIPDVLGRKVPGVPSNGSDRAGTLQF